MFGLISRVKRGRNIPLFFNFKIMKKLLLILLLVPKLVFGQYNSDYLDVATATIGTGMVLSELPNGEFSYSGAALIGLAVLNNQLHLVNIHPTPNKWLKLGLYTSSIVFDAIADSRRDKGLYMNSHFYEALSVASLVSIPMFTFTSKNDWWKLGLSYTLMRYSLFDYTYNIDRNLPLDYHGNTSKYDKVLNDIPNEVVNFTKGLSLIASITINLN